MKSTTRKAFALLCACVMLSANFAQAANSIFNVEDNLTTQIEKPKAKIPKNS